MKKSTFLSASGALASLIFSVGAMADFANGPNPYAAGFGFDRPNEPGASANGWGGWSRGDSGTIYAEWDQFTGAPNPAPVDVGSSGTSSATLGWNAGTFAAGSGNLYNFSGTEIFDIAVAAGPANPSGSFQVALQTETWGIVLEEDNEGNPLSPVTLDGVQWDQKIVTYEDPTYPSTFGPVLLQEALFLWTLDELPGDGVFDFHLETGPHSSFAQAAVDIGPAPVPVPAAVWLFGSGLLGMLGIARRRTDDKLS